MKTKASKFTKGMKRSILLLLLVACISNLSFAQSGDKVIDRIVAVVGEKIILQSDIEGQKIQAQQSGVKFDGPIECSLIESLLFESLLSHQADIDSVEVSEDQVEIELENRIRYFRAQLNSMGQTLEGFYGKTITEIKEEFRSAVRDRLKSQAMQRQITSEAAVSPAEIKEYYNSFEKDSLPRIGSQVEVAHIVRQPKISPAMKNEALEKLVKLRKEIMAGDISFSTAALFNSDDPGSKDNGGDLGWVSRGEFVPEFEAIVFALEEGAISEAFESQFGFHVVKLIERRGEKFHAQHILKSPKLTATQLQEASDYLDNVYKLIESDSLTFKEAAQIYSDDDETKNNGGVIFNRNTGSTMFEMSQIDRQIFVTIDNMDAGGVSKPVIMQSPDGKSAYRIVMLKKRTKPHIANLKEDYQYIQNAALTKKQGEAIANWIRKTINTSYIRIDDDFQSCDFDYPWMKSQ
jgi:peptidyl-prolyl cis-trans isomerase SurA